LKVKPFGRIILGFESYLTRFINWISGTDMVFGSLQNNTCHCFSVFFSSIALVPAGFIGVFFAASDSGEF
jgi:HAE1 family hydrophobic/amphiphilic exporter-1